MTAGPAETSVAPPRPSTAGVVLVCDGPVASPLVEGAAAARDLYTGLTAAILQHSRSAVVFHLQRGSPEAAAIREAIERCGGLQPEYGARMRMLARVPLESLLPCADLLVSFASPALIKGGRNGLKPIQIGRVLRGSEAFSHVFSDVAGFARSLAAGGLAGTLSLGEYAQFEEFRRRLAGGSDLAGAGTGAAWRLFRDPVRRECRRAERGRVAWLRAAASVLANPVAAFRLALAMKIVVSSRPRR